MSPNWPASSKANQISCMARKGCCASLLIMLFSSAEIGNLVIPMRRFELVVDGIALLDFSLASSWVQEGIKTPVREWLFFSFFSRILRRSSFRDERFLHQLIIK